MAERPTKIMVQLGTNINCLLSYVATGASSGLSYGVKDIASKEGKGLLATKTTTEKKDKAKKAPSLAPPRRAPWTKAGPDLRRRAIRPLRGAVDGGRGGSRPPSQAAASPRR